MALKFKSNLLFLLDRNSSPFYFLETIGE